VKIETFAIMSRLLLRDRTNEAARLRRRVVAGGALALFVLGFLVAVGFGKIALIVLAVPLVAVTAPQVVGLAQRVRPRLGRPRIPQLTIPRPVRRAPSRRQALRLNARGAAHRRSGQHRRAVEAHSEALSLMRAAGDRRGEALTLNNLALAFTHAGQDDAALDHFERALAILRELDDGQREGQVFANLGLMHGRRGRHEQAVGCLQVALDKLDPDSHEYRRVEEQLRRAS
jgi:tetratricopeptide (TPR) repeat protein